MRDFAAYVLEGGAGEPLCVADERAGSDTAVSPCVFGDYGDDRPRIPAPTPREDPATFYAERMRAMGEIDGRLISTARATQPPAAARHLANASSSERHISHSS